MMIFQHNSHVRVAAGLALGVIMLSTPTFANHSENMFDKHTQVTLLGTVKSFLWANPHSLIVLQVDQNDAGHAIYAGLWQIETASLKRLASQGWTKQTLKAGDKISIEVNTALTKSRNAFARKLKLVNGNTIAVPEQ